MSRRGRPSRDWHPLPRGRFTGIEWARHGALDGSDPYLAWAETSGFAGFRSPLGQPAQPEWLPLLIELHADATLSDLLALAPAGCLQVPRVYLDLGADLRFCTARVRRPFFGAVQSGGVLHPLVRRYELGMAVGHHARALPPAACAGATQGRLPAQVDGDVIVLIDNGLALAHADFLQGPDHRTRVAAFWRQDETQGPHGRAAASLRPTPLDPARCGPAPADLGYGHVLDRRAIDQALAAHARGGRVDEDALYRHWQMWDLEHARHHGTHVGSLAAGPQVYTCTIGTEDSPPDWRPAHDAASRATLLVVQLDWASVADSSGGALNVSVTDALAWALARCAPTARVAVNLSWGALAGPHNGTSLLEAALAGVIAASGRQVQLVIPAGNAYQDRTHANAVIRRERPLQLHWRVQPDDHSQSFLELWFEDRRSARHALEDLRIAITPPGCDRPLEPVRLGTSGAWPSAERPQCAVMFPSNSGLGHPGTCAVVALAPTASWFGDAVRTRAGVWQVELRNHSDREVVVDAYIERDDVALGSAPTGARQSYLEAACYDTSGGIDSFIDHPENPCAVRRSGTFNDIATGQGTVSVGGVRYFASATDPMARYSPRSPDPDAARPERQAVLKVPDRFAVSDDHASLWGVRAAGTRSAATVRLVGTSMAAPQVARQKLDDGT